MSWSSVVRQWWDELFRSHLVTHLEEENKYLRSQVEQMRIDNARLQLTLTQVTAGPLIARLEHPAQRPAAPTAPKRWQQVLDERNEEIRQIRLKAQEQKPSPEQAQAAS